MRSHSLANRQRTQRLPIGERPLTALSRAGLCANRTARTVVARTPATLRALLLFGCRRRAPLLSNGDKMCTVETEIAEFMARLVLNANQLAGEAGWRVSRGNGLTAYATGVAWEPSHSCEISTSAFPRRLWLAFAPAVSCWYGGPGLAVLAVVPPVSAYRYRGGSVRNWWS
jgi:hypothetical protein